MELVWAEQIAEDVSYELGSMTTVIKGLSIGGHGGLCTGTSRIGAAIGTFATPLAVTHLGLSGKMWIAAGIALLGAAVSFFMAPETRRPSSIRAGSSSSTSRAQDGGHAVGGVSGDPLCLRRDCMGP